MSKFKKFCFLIAITLTGTAAFGQTQDSYDYNSEFTWGINKNTYSGLLGGLFFKQAYKISSDQSGMGKNAKKQNRWRDDRTLITYGVEFINVKHPQESRVTARSSGNQYIFAKLNYLYAVRPQIGIDRILFKKAPQQGAEIKAVFAAGPTFGFVVPYYVQLSGNNGDISTYVKYTPSVPIAQISGAGRPFQGIGESKIKMGLNLKAALNFEIGTVKSQVTGFEAGFLLDAYSGKVPLMTGAKNYALYPTFFMSIFYGSRK